MCTSAESGVPLQPLRKAVSRVAPDPMAEHISRFNYVSDSTLTRNVTSLREPKSGTLETIRNNPISNTHRVEIPATRVPAIYV